MNEMKVYWSVAVSNEPLNSAPYYKLDETTKFTRLGANTLLAAFSSKELAIAKGLEIMHKYQLAGQILAITELQFEKKTIVPASAKDDEITLNLNLEYTITIYHDGKKIIIPFTKEQFKEIVKFNTGNNGASK